MDPWGETEVLIINQARLRRVMHKYIAFFNLTRPHQGIKQAQLQKMLDHFRVRLVNGRQVLQPLDGVCLKAPLVLMELRPRHPRWPPGSFSLACSPTLRDRTKSPHPFGG